MKFILLMLLSFSVSAMSYNPENADNDTVYQGEVSYKLPFLREMNSKGIEELMTWDEYKSINFYVDGEYYDWASPPIEEFYTPDTLLQQNLLIAKDTADVTITLTDQDGSESIHSKAVNFNWTAPGAPVITCQ